MELTELPNIGPELSRQLTAAGIRTPEELREAGAEAAFLRLMALDTTSCMHKLTALEGAVQGVRKTKLPPERKAELKEFFQGLKGR